MEVEEFIHTIESLRNGLLLQARRYLKSDDAAEDAVQETLVKLWMARDRIADAVKARNMAAVVCRNVSLNMLRDARYSLHIDSAMDIAQHDNPQKQMEEGESHLRLTRCISSLNDKQRAILRMRNVENMSYADIARILATTESSVRGMISKARMELLKMMKGQML